MTPKTIRLIVGFLAVFVLLSIAPAIPDFIATLNDGNGLELPAINDTVLLAIGGCVALLGLVVVIRQRKAGDRRTGDGRASAGRASVPARSTQLPAAARTTGIFTRRIMPEHSGPYPTISSPLHIRLRAAAGKGERLPAIARRNGLSVDAVRAALGTSAASAPAARTGSSFRSTQPTLPPKPRARPVPASRTSYQATI